MLEDLNQNKCLIVRCKSRAIEKMLCDKKVKFVSYQEWQKLDQLELQRDKPPDAETEVHTREWYAYRACKNNRRFFQ